MAPPTSRYVGAREERLMRRLVLAVAALTVAAAAAVAQDSLWEKYMSAGAESFAKGNYAEAEKMWLAARKEAEGFGPQDVRLGATLSNLAELYRREGKLPAAGWLTGARLSSRSARWFRHPQVATILNNLGRSTRHRASSRKPSASSGAVSSSGDPRAE
jgi:hypothetical protein